MNSIHQLVLVSVLTASQVLPEALASAAPNGKYVDPQVPGASARVFAPGVVSVARGQGTYAERPVFTPDCRECFFDVTDYATKKFTGYSMVRDEQGDWSRPKPAFFAPFGGCQASISPDGQALFFVAPNPRDASVRGIWQVRRQAGAWGTPEFLPAPVNTTAGAGFPCVVRGGTLYYHVFSGPEHGLHRAVLVNGRYAETQRIVEFQPTADCNFGDFYVAADESLLVIYSTRSDNLGSGDLYISFRSADGAWSRPANLGAAVNTPGYDFAPSLTPDAHFLFFTRDRGGTGDVCWIALSALPRPSE